MSPKLAVPDHHRSPFCGPPIRITAFITPILQWSQRRVEPCNHIQLQHNDIHSFRINLVSSCLIWNVGVDTGDAPSHWTLEPAQPPQLQIHAYYLILPRALQPLPLSSLTREGSTVTRGLLETAHYARSRYQHSGAIQTASVSRAPSLSAGQRPVRHTRGASERGLCHVSCRPTVNYHTSVAGRRPVKHLQTSFW